MLNRLVQLEENIHELENIRKTIDDSKFSEGKLSEWGLRYGLFESIQIVIDIACHLVAKYNLGNPQNYRECITLLNKYNYIAKDVAQNLEKMIGLRNLLVHEYADINMEELKNLLHQLNDFKKFIQEIREYM